MAETVHARILHYLIEAHATEHHLEKVFQKYADSGAGSFKTVLNCLSQRAASHQVSLEAALNERGTTVSTLRTGIAGAWPSLRSMRAWAIQSPRKCLNRESSQLRRQLIKKPYTLLSQPPLPSSARTFRRSLPGKCSLRKRLTSRPCARPRLLPWKFRTSTRKNS